MQKLFDFVYVDNLEVDFKAKHLFVVLHAEKNPHKREYHS